MSMYQMEAIHRYNKQNIHMFKFMSKCIKWRHRYIDTIDTHDTHRHVDTQNKVYKAYILNIIIRTPEPGDKLQICCTCVLFKALFVQFRAFFSKAIIPR